MLPCVVAWKLTDSSEPAWHVGQPRYSHPRLSPYYNHYSSIILSQDKLNCAPGADMVNAMYLQPSGIGPCSLKKFLCFFLSVVTKILSALLGPSPGMSHLLAIYRCDVLTSVNCLKHGMILVKFATYMSNWKLSFRNTDKPERAWSGFWSQDPITTRSETDLKGFIYSEGASHIVRKTSEKLLSTWLLKDSCCKLEWIIWFFRLFYWFPNLQGSSGYIMAFLKETDMADFNFSRWQTIGSSQFQWPGLFARYSGRVHYHRQEANWWNSHQLYKWYIKKYCCSYFTLASRQCNDWKVKIQHTANAKAIKIGWS